MKFRGVHRRKDGSFTATIGREGKAVYLGYFQTEDAAIAARRSAEVLLYGATFDRREIEIDGATARLPMHGHGGQFHGWATIDAADLSCAEHIAWTLDGRGYVVGRPPGSRGPVTLHRWLMGERVDHIDRDRTNNQRSNLRPCTAAENARNTSLARNNSSGAKGVSRTEKGNWRARITVDRREIYIGTFLTVEAASRAYDAAAHRYHGAFASPNEAM